VLDAANFAVSAAAASLVFQALDEWRLLGAVLAGILYAAVNNGLLCFAMSLAERTPWRKIWSERFHWARFHFVLFGPLALAATIAYEQIGTAGLVAFALPPALMILSVRHPLGTRSPSLRTPVRSLEPRTDRRHGLPGQARRRRDSPPCAHRLRCRCARRVDQHTPVSPGTLDARGTCRDSRARR